MAGANVIKEYLVGMGLQDNFTDEFNKVMDNSNNRMGKFASTFAGKFAIAGTAVVSAVAIGNVAIGKFLGNMAKSDLAMDMYAKSIKKTKEETVRLDTTLKAMGRTMEEINSNAELKMNFDKLQEDAEKVQPPDMSEGMEQVREIQFEFTRLKQNATYALNWVGYYLTKYLAEPIRQVKELFKGLNDGFIKDMPVWTEKIAHVLSWIVRLGTTLIRGATTVFRAIKRIFDMIPRELKLVGAAIVALGILIRAGPIGKLAMVITGILLLLDDFYTYLDGGDALLGGFWQRLIDIYETLKNSGAIDRFKESMTNAFEFSARKVVELKDYVIHLFNKFKESGSIEKFLTLIGRLVGLLIAIGVPLKNVGRDIFIAFAGDSKNALEWFIEKGLPGMIDLISGAIGVITDIINKLNEFGATEVIIKGIAIAFAAWKLGGIISDIYKATAAILASSKAKVADTIATLAATKAKIADKAETLAIGALYVKDTVLKGASTAATWAQTAATTAWNVVAGIGATVTTAFGAAVAFLTSPIGLVILAVGALIAIVVLLIKNWDKVGKFFTSLWSKTKETFAPVANWFKQKFTEGKEAVILAFSPVIDYFSMIFKNIGLIFSGVRALFSGDFQGAYDAVVAIWNNITGFWKKIFGMLPQPVQNAILKIKEVFSPIVKWFSDKVLGIIKAFSNIPSSLREAFVKAVKAIKDVFSPLVDWFKEKVDAIKGFFGGIGDKVKGVFGKGEPDPKGKPPPPSPKPIGHSQGGLFLNRHEAEIAEDGPEAVVPLTKPNRAREILSQIQNFISPEDKQSGGALKLDGVGRALSQITSMLGGIEAGLNRQENINYTSQGGNVTVNNITISPQSNNKIYGSNAEATANAVNRNTTESTGLLLRNMQGVIG